FRLSLCPRLSQQSFHKLRRLSGCLVRYTVLEPRRRHDSVCSVPPEFVPNFPKRATPYFRPNIRNLSFGEAAEFCELSVIGECPHERRFQSEYLCGLFTNFWIVQIAAGEVIGKPGLDCRILVNPVLIPISFR